MTQELNTKHWRYTNELYNYSNPSNSGQRLLTGSYASWQWYDRSNLASPTNLNLTKVSRINYAFFQSNAEGYIFGTDSWADPNILFGSYEFAINSDSLSERCKGGKGRDDGKYAQDVATNSTSHITKKSNQFKMDAIYHTDNQ